MESVGGAALIISILTGVLAILKWLTDKAATKELRNRVEALEKTQRVHLDYIEHLRYWGSTTTDPTPRQPPPYPPAMRVIYVPQPNTD